MYLRVYSKQGRLLAARKFLFLRESPLNYVRYKDDRIEYSHDQSDHRSIDIPTALALKMPPDWWDWLAANLGLLINGR